ncbi:MAG: hypothetical protein ACJ77K_11845 [Bacteroidia bacterium]
MAKTKIPINTPPSSASKRNVILLSLLAIAVSLIYSYKLRWLGDDIFIALRYVQHFIAGQGLVYNPGEKVEGFTDFLWLMLISFFTKLNFDPMNVTQFLGILSSLGTLALCSLIGIRIAQKHNTFIIPFVVISLALNYDYNVWATSGLETSFYTFLLCAAFFIYFFSELSENKRLLFSGLFLSLAMMTRPDAMLIIAVVNTLMVAYHFLHRRNVRGIISLLLRFNLALIVIYLPYFLWRYNYFGFIFPNTYYDKLGGESFFSKGFYYLWLYFKPHFTAFLIFILPPFVLIPLFKGKLIENIRNYSAKPGNAAYLTSIIAVYAYLLIFVAKVGGDFMHARFVIPMAPFMAFIIFYSALQYFSTAQRLNTVLVLLLLCSYPEMILRFDVFKAPDKNGNIITTLNRDVADERYVYTEYLPISEDIKLGKAIHRAFAGIDAKMLVRGGQACLGYFANFSYEQEYHGLTDTLIAHSKVAQRSRIGHEKHATYEYLQNKGINLLFNRSPISKDQYKYAQIDIPPFRLRTEIITFNNKIIDQMRERFGDSFQYTDFRAYLDQYIQSELTQRSKEQIKKDYDSFYLYYFKHNDDKARENKFLDALK